MNKANHQHGIVNLRNTFFSEVGIGMLGNAILLLFHIVRGLLKLRLKPTDVIIALLPLIHLTMLVILGFIATDVFESQDFWDDIKCKSLSYLHRFLRGLSICATCLLSVLQAVTLSSRGSRLAKFKQKSPYHSLISLLLLWVFYVCFSAHFSYTTVANLNVTSQGLIFLTESCAILPLSHSLGRLFSMLGIVRDVIIIGLMALSSGYMLTLLCRHKRRSQHLHSSSLSPKASPEQRATQTILLLMSFFVLTYCFDCIVSSSRIIWNNDPIGRSLQIMAANGYATLSPWIFISTDKQIVNFFKSFFGKIANV